LSVICDQRYTN